MESPSEKEMSAEADTVVAIETLRRDSILSETSRPSIDLILDDTTSEPSKDVTSTGKRRSITAETRMKGLKYMNTYRLESMRPFNVEKVHGILQEVLTRELEEAVYEPGNALKTCLSLTSEIRTRVKTLNFDRYKIICLVSIVEKKMQSILSVAKFLWDTERDRHTSYSFSNSHLSSMACVFGIYYE